MIINTHIHRSIIPFFIRIVIIIMHNCILRTLKRYSLLFILFRFPFSHLLQSCKIIHNLIFQTLIIKTFRTFTLNKHILLHSQTMFSRLIKHQTDRLKSYTQSQFIRIIIMIFTHQKLIQYIPLIFSQQQIQCLFLIL
jgi:hypothetical protein